MEHINIEGLIYSFLIAGVITGCIYWFAHAMANRIVNHKIEEGQGWQGHKVYLTKDQYNELFNEEKKDD